MISKSMPPESTGTPRFWWEGEAERLRAEYRSAKPFPHLVVDGFLDEERLRAIAREEYADVGSPRWTYHRHYSQKTYSRTDFSTFGRTTREVIEELAAPWFIAFLHAITGLEGLFLDASLEDGGLTACARGGFANIHTDLTVHPAHRHWQRRVNVLLYLNEQWHESYNGHLELWDERVRQCVRKIELRFNRCVIFEPTLRALHGYPEVLRCPPENPRKCLALYYFTDEKVPPRLRYFTYHARPGEGIKHLLVWLDNRAIHTYERLRKWLGINDRMVNRFMRLFGAG